jgi:hypothetical protein
VEYTFSRGYAKDPILEINGLGVVTREAVEAAREVLVIGAA